MMDTKLLEQALLDMRRECYTKGATDLIGDMTEALTEFKKERPAMSIKETMDFLKFSLDIFVKAVNERSPNLQESNNG